MTDKIPKTMRAFAIDRFGEPGSLRDLPIPEIGPGDVLIRVRAAGVNPLDLKIRDGIKPAGEVSFPHVLGQDAAGAVVRVGESVTGYTEGSQVYGGFWLSGAFAEYVKVTVSKAAISLIPVGLDFERASALPTPGLAAAAALQAVNLLPGETLLVIGATGGVGSYVVQLAARKGAKLLVTSRKDTEEYIRRLGATETFDYSRGDIVEIVKAAHPAGIDAVVDVVSGREALVHVSSVLRSGGRLVTTIHAADEAAMLNRGIHAANVDVFGTTDGLDELSRLMEERELVIPVERRFPLSETASALAAIASGHTRGKIVLTITDERN